MVSTRLRTLREKAGMTREDLAARLGVSGKDIRAWEAGRLPETEQLAALAALFGVTTDYLLGLGREAISLSGLTGEEKAFLRRLAGYFHDRGEKR